MIILKPKLSGVLIPELDTKLNQIQNFQIWKTNNNTDSESIMTYVHAY